MLQYPFHQTYLFLEGYQVLLWYDTRIHNEGDGERHGPPDYKM